MVGIAHPSILSLGIIVAEWFEEAGLARHLADHQEGDGTQAFRDRGGRVVLEETEADATHPGLILRRRSCRASSRQRVRWPFPARQSPRRHSHQGRAGEGRVAVDDGRAQGRLGHHPEAEGYRLAEECPRLAP